jgi:hypothetical protein
MSVCESIDIKRNREGAAPDMEFKIFFGRKSLCHNKADKPCMPSALQHLQELWIGMGKVLTKKNWPVVFTKMKYLSNLIQEYSQRISSKAERSPRLSNTNQPARIVESASYVALIEPLLPGSFLPREHYRIKIKLMNVEVYVQLDGNPFMEGCVAMQRRECFLALSSG